MLSQRAELNLRCVSPVFLNGHLLTEHVVDGEKGVVVISRVLGCSLQLSKLAVEDGFDVTNFLVARLELILQVGEVGIYLFQTGIQLTGSYSLGVRDSLAVS
jgi:hypothetical protein